MTKRAAVIALILAIGALLALGAMTFATFSIAPRILGAGPDGIDLRPTPGAVDPEMALPREIAGYRRSECRKITTYRELALGPDAVEAFYTGRASSVHVIAARLPTYHAAAAAVSDLAQYLEQSGFLSSRRLRAEQPYRGWWNASGKRNFAYWYAPAWDADQHGFIWQSGRWCFVVASNNPVARLNVSLAFPY